jgi:hypothetical protein
VQTVRKQQLLNPQALFSPSTCHAPAMSINLSLANRTNASNVARLEHRALISFSVAAIAAMYSTSASFIIALQDFPSQLGLEQFVFEVLLVFESDGDVKGVFAVRPDATYFWRTTTSTALADDAVSAEEIHWNRVRPLA